MSSRFFDSDYFRMTLGLKTKPLDVLAGRDSCEALVNKSARSFLEILKHISPKPGLDGRETDRV